MPSIESRLTALADALQRRRMIQEMPVDALSRSLFAMQDELAELDAEGKTALLEAMNHPTDGESGGLNLTMKELEQFLANYGRKD